MLTSRCLSMYQAANGANRSSGMVEAYRNLTNLRASFEELIATVCRVCMVSAGVWKLMDISLRR